MLSVLPVFVVIIYLTITTAYLLTLTILALFFRKRTSEASQQLRIAVVVPAHNEEMQMQLLLEGINNSDYPDACYSTFVIADNCTDQTAAEARKYGAKVYERNDPENAGKGAALDWFFKDQQAAYSDYDAVTILDADTQPHPRFLKEISNSLSEESVDAVQGYYTVLNPNDNWMTALSLAALSIVHHLRPAGRNCIGCTAGLKGNGMGFTSEMIRKHGWPCNSVVEDIELTLYLLQQGIVVHYNPDAIVFGEMPVNHQQAEPQRRRWEHGRVSLFKKYWKDLLWRFCKTRKLYYLDAFMDLFTAPLSLLVLGNLILLVFTWVQYHSYTLEGVLLFNMMSLVFYVFAGLSMRKPPAYVWLALLASPFFVIFKLTLYLKMMIARQPMLWTRTRRKSEL